MKKKVIAAIGFCGLMLSSSVSGMNQFEVENGFTGMKRDIVLRLVKFIELSASNEKPDAKTRNVFGMCAEHWIWKQHKLFRIIRRSHLEANSMPYFLTTHFILERRSDRYAADQTARAREYLAKYTVPHPLNQRVRLFVRPSLLCEVMDCVERGNMNRSKCSGTFLTNFLARTFDNNKIDHYGLQLIRCVTKETDYLDHNHTVALLMLIVTHRRDIPDYLKLFERIFEEAPIHDFEPLIPLIGIAAKDRKDKPLNVLVASKNGKAPLNRKMIVANIPDYWAATLRILLRDATNFRSIAAKCVIDNVADKVSKNHQNVPIDDLRSLFKLIYSESEYEGKLTRLLSRCHNKVSASTIAHGLAKDASVRDEILDASELASMLLKSVAEDR